MKNILKYTKGNENYKDTVHVKKTPTHNFNSINYINPISWIISLLLVVVSLAGCDHQHQLSQDEMDAGVNQRISQTAKDLLAKPTSGNLLCMLLAYRDFESVGIDVAYKDLEGGDTCYHQRVYLDKDSGTIYVDYMEPPAGTPLGYDAYTNYHVVGKHYMAGIPDYRTDTDTITIHSTPVIREYAPSVSFDNDSTGDSFENTTFVFSECTLFTRIPQGMIRLTYRIGDHEPTPKQETCQIAEKALTLLLDRAATEGKVPQYCLTISPSWLAAHRLTTYPSNNYCQNQTYYYLSKPHAQVQKTIGSISISILNNVKDTKYYEEGSKKSTLENHTIYTKIWDKINPSDYNDCTLYLPMKDRNMLYISISSPHIPLKELEHTAKQITIYELEHNLPQ